MGLQIENLLEKYWCGETTLEEEKEIKSHFESNLSLTTDDTYFRYLFRKQQIKFEGANPTMIRKKIPRLSAVATITIGLVTAISIFNDAKKDPFAIDNPEKAFQATMEALMMIGAEINEGQNHTLKLTKINKAKEELQEEIEES